VGCGDREETYYPVINCTEGCGEATASGEVVPRRRITVPPVQYTALVERQDVIREVQGLGPESLTRLGWMCTVRSGRDWECVDASSNEQIVMVHGYPHDTTINDHEYSVVFVPYCVWKQIQWHNQSSRVPDDLPWTPTPHSNGDGLTGCDPGLPIPWYALITNADPTSADVERAMSPTASTSQR
jgi:hypothetical protein